MSSQTVKHNIVFSDPLQRVYNEIGVIKGDDVFMDFIFEGDYADFVGQGYNLTIYDKDDRTTLVSVSLDATTKEGIIDDFSFDTEEALIVVEDRSDISNIETVTTLGFIYFVQFEGGTTATTVEGFVSVEDTDGSQITAPYHSTGIQII